MAGTIKIVISSFVLAILCCGFATPVHVSAATHMPSISRLRIIEATQKASQYMAAMKAMQCIEEEAMLAMHSFTIKAGGYSFSLHNDGISPAATHIPPAWNVLTHSFYLHTNVMLRMVYVMLLAVAYCYERFYYRQREAYPPCEFLYHELSHTYINASGICCIPSIISKTPVNSVLTINKSFLFMYMSLLPCSVLYCITVSRFQHTHIKTSPSEKYVHIPISVKHEVRL